MSNWEKVTQDKELLSKVENWVRGLSIDSPQEIFDEMNRLTGNDWSREQYESHIFDYPDFYDMEEVVYALFHEGKYPERKSEDFEALKLGNDGLDVKKLYRDLLEAFPEWNEDVDSYENLFYLKNKEVYGFEKSIFIRKVYDRKFLSCTLTNMNQEEKDTFVNVVRKYCNHVVREEENKMSIMDRINKSDYVEVFSAVLGKVMVAQERGNEYVVKDRDWTYDFVEGTISFGEDVYPVQFIGIEEETWEWASEEDYEEFDKSVFSLVNESYALGEEWKLKALTLPELKLEDGYNGDYLSVICCGISKERYIYYRVEQNEILLFMGIGNAPEEVYAPVDRNEFKKIVTKCIKDFPIDHKIFLEAFLEWNNTPYEWNGDNVIAHFDKDLVFVFEEDEGDYSITSIKTVSGSEPSNEQANSRISITLEDGEINIQGIINLGYIGTFTDEEIEIDDTLEEIREWDIVQDNLDEDCTDEELIAFLNRYFNEFADKITRNIDNINGTFLLQTLTDMECNEIDFMVIDELFLEDKLPYGNEEDIAELYNFARNGMRSLVPYLESPNDGCIPKGHIESLLRSFYPAFDFDCFIANIVPEVLTLCDGSIAFQCSDAFDEAILCGAYAELDEELCFTDWHNF